MLFFLVSFYLLKVIKWLSVLFLIFHTSVNLPLVSWPIAREDYSTALTCLKASMQIWFNLCIDGWIWLCPSLMGNWYLDSRRNSQSILAVFVWIIFHFIFLRKTRELAKELNDKAIEAQVCLFIDNNFFYNDVLAFLNCSVKLSNVKLILTSDLYCDYQFFTNLFLSNTSLL